MRNKWLLVVFLLLHSLLQAQSLAVGLGVPTYQDEFTSGNIVSGVLTTANSNRWDVSSYSTNNYAGCGSANTFKTANVNLSNGMLEEILTQSTTGTSNASEILSETTFSYGTFEFYARFGSTSPTPGGVGSTISGGVSSPFLINNSGTQGPGYTEIDAPEIEGIPSRAGLINYAVYKDTNNSVPTGGNFTSGHIVLPGTALPYTGFHYYGFIWSSGSIDVYLDGVYQGSDKTNIPVSPASIDINHYGCNFSQWGGLATVGVTRYFYVKSVKVWDNSFASVPPSITGVWK